MRDYIESLRTISAPGLGFKISLEHTFYEVPRKHLDPPRPFPPPLQLVRRNHRVLIILLQLILREEIRSLLPITLIALSVTRSGPSPTRQTSDLRPRRVAFSERQRGM